MKIKRISIIIYLLSSIFFVLLFIININDANSVMYPLSLAFIPSTTIPLLLEIPSIINYKINKKRFLFNTIIDIKGKNSLIECNLDKFLNDNIEMVDNVFTSFVNDISSLSVSLNNTDKDLYLRKSNNELLFKYNSLFINAINSLIVADKYFSVSYSKIRYEKAINNNSTNVFSNELTSDLNKIKNICKDIDNICSLFIKNLFNNKYKQEYEIRVNSITISLNNMKVSDK